MEKNSGQKHQKKRKHGEENLEPSACSMSEQSSSADADDLGTTCDHKSAVVFQAEGDDGCDLINGKKLSVISNYLHNVVLHDTHCTS